MIETLQPQLRPGVFTPDFVAPVEAPGVAQAPDFMRPALPRWASRTLAVAGVFFAIGGMAESASAAKKASVIENQRVERLYTPLTPAAILGEAGTAMAASVGSTAGYREYTPATAAQQTELNKLGAKAINSIPGQGVDIMQTTTRLSGDPATAAKVELACPDPYSRQPYPAIKSAEIAVGSQAVLEFCPSPTKIAMMPVDLANPKFSQSFNNWFLKDSIRNTKWGGDQYKNNVYGECQIQPFDYDPELKARFSPRKGMKVSFKGMSIIRYCDKVRQNTTKAVMQFRKSKRRHSQQRGGSVTLIGGLREILVSGDPNVMYSSNTNRYRGRLPETAIKCTSKLRNALARVKLTRSSKGWRGQEFQHDSSGNSNDTPSRKKPYYSRWQRICRT